ncbi:TAXI family TRAP transporter solute-binding subunit [Oceanobacillus bengalensis]|uniref:TAXI family TRAP transporter solute-binding subunit n=1 Tax=Oceanobacillus bengalensis TaxID=1435466 RepID=UPI0015FFDDE5|nr:TAXI family TRAP transporter solute-binding subunit [Oceanobacillus bengalensis]
MSRQTAIATLMLLCLFILSACGNENVVSKADEASIKTDKTSPIQTTIIGGRTGGAWSIFTEGIAESIRRNNVGSMITVEPGGIVENPPTVGVNKIPYGLSYAMTAYAAYIGEEPYERAYEDIRAVSVVIPANYYQFVVPADVPFDSFEEIVENQVALRLAVDQKGSAGEIITRNIFESYGVSYDDITTWGGSVDYLGGSKAFEMMSDHRIDATGDAVSVPSSDIIEASTILDLKIIALSQETVQVVSEKLGMEPNTIEAGSYTFLDEDLNTLSTQAILMVHKDVPEEEVYQVTKSIYDNLEYLGNVHEEFKKLIAEKMTDVGNVPLHPGAETFFREQGLIE